MFQPFFVALVSCLMQTERPGSAGSAVQSMFGFLCRFRLDGGAPERDPESETETGRLHPDQRPPPAAAGGQNVPNRLRKRRVLFGSLTAGRRFCLCCLHSTPRGPTKTDYCWLHLQVVPPTSTSRVWTQSASCPVRSESWRRRTWGCRRSWSSLPEVLMLTWPHLNQKLKN